MNRPIKFRAKRASNGRWVKWELLDDTEDFLHWIKVETISQFTGLLDKNGKEIYEGDVVDIEYMSDGFKIRGNVTIVFRNGAFRAKTDRDYLFDLAEDDNEVIYGEPEVIGNVFENPELLKDSK